MGGNHAVIDDGQHTMCVGALMTALFRFSTIIDMSTTSTQSPLFIWPKIQLARGATKAAPLACHGTWPMRCLPQPRGLQEMRLRSGMVLQPSLPEARLVLFRRTSPGSLPAASTQRHLQFSQRPQQGARSHSVLHHQVSSQGSSVNELGLWMHVQFAYGKYLCDLVGWSPHPVRRRPLGTHGLPFDMTICPSGRSQPLG